MRAHNLVIKCPSLSRLPIISFQICLTQILFSNFLMGFS
jgi:hypothetical protein